jgi:hypothetical protein
MHYLQIVRCGRHVARNGLRRLRDTSAVSPEEQLNESGFVRHESCVSTGGRNVINTWPASGRQGRQQRE